MPSLANQTRFHSESLEWPRIVKFMKRHSLQEYLNITFIVVVWMAYVCVCVCKCKCVDECMWRMWMVCVYMYGSGESLLLWPMILICIQFKTTTTTTTTTKNNNNNIVRKLFFFSPEQQGTRGGAAAAAAAAGAVQCITQGNVAASSSNRERCMTPIRRKAIKAQF